MSGCSTVDVVLGFPRRRLWTRHGRDERRGKKGSSWVVAKRRMRRPKQRASRTGAGSLTVTPPPAFLASSPIVRLSCAFAAPRPACLRVLAGGRWQARRLPLIPSLLLHRTQHRVPVRLVEACIVSHAMYIACLFLAVCHASAQVGRFLLTYHSSWTGGNSVPSITHVPGSRLPQAWLLSLSREESDIWMGQSLLMWLLCPAD